MKSKTTGTFAALITGCLLLPGAVLAATAEEPEPAPTVTNTQTQTQTETETNTKTRTETKTHTPPARTVTETQVARSADRTPVEAPKATTNAAPAPAPPANTSAPQAQPAPAGGVWDQLAQCESGGDWTTNTGNGYYGGIQFSAQTWKAFGGGQYAPLAHQASKSQQIAIAQKVKATQGWGAWPACSAKIGLR